MSFDSIWRSIYVKKKLLFIFIIKATIFEYGLTTSFYSSFDYLKKLHLYNEKNFAFTKDKWKIKFVTIVLEDKKN